MSEHINKFLDELKQIEAVHNQRRNTPAIKEKQAELEAHQQAAAQLQQELITLQQAATPKTSADIMDAAKRCSHGTEHGAAITTAAQRVNATLRTCHILTVDVARAYLEHYLTDYERKRAEAEREEKRGAGLIVEGRSNRAWRRIF